MNAQSFMPDAWRHLESARGAYAAASRAKSSESRAHWLAIAANASRQAAAAFDVAMIETREAGK
jgi:hypothetical protein